MNHHNRSLNTHLQALDDLLVCERLAITHLRIQQLNKIQQEKTRLLTLFNQAEQVVDNEGIALIDRIKKNNLRNRMLLESGLKLIGRLQDNVFRRLALTYAAHGRSLTIGAGPRLLNRSA
jgi:hypothetical protein